MRTAAWISFSGLFCANAIWADNGNIGRFIRGATVRVVSESDSEEYFVYYVLCRVACEVVHGSDKHAQEHVCPSITYWDGAPVTAV